MNTFKNAQYTITTSISEDNIYIKVINNISYECYENTFDKSMFRLSFNTTSRFTIINKCFAALTGNGTEKSAYAANISLESADTMLIIFDCLFDGAIGIDFALRLKQKIVSNDSVVSAELEKQTQLVERLVERLDAAEKMIEQQNKKIDGLSDKLESAENYIAGIDRAIVAMSLNSISLQRLYDHADIKITDTMEIFEQSMLHNLHKFPFITKIIVIFQAPHMPVPRLLLLDDIEYPPTNITHICIKSCIWDKNMNLSFIKSFPNLEYLTFVNCIKEINAKEAIQNLSSTEHKIKKITCNHHNVKSNELQIYCEKYGITLLLQ